MNTHLFFLLFISYFYALVEVSVSTITLARDICMRSVQVHKLIKVLTLAKDHHHFILIEEKQYFTNKPFKNSMLTNVLIMELLVS